MAAEHRVLLVEDDETLRYAMKASLERAGFAVDDAPDGKAAIAKLDAGASYCGVMLDMLIPNIHGTSVLMHVARTRPRLPIIAVTGYPDRVLFADQAARDMVKAIFVKPVDPADVAAYLRSMCRREE
jgi:two-component system chemotaxis response regulator CheY